MDGPGLSIFQGSDIKINSSLQRREEEEFLEEGKKREAELKDLFEEAFDDLNGDTTLDSSQYSTNHSDAEFHPIKSNYRNGNDDSDFDETPPHRKDQPPQLGLIRENKKALQIPVNTYEMSKNAINQAPLTPRTESDLTMQHYNHCFKKPGFVENSSEVNVYKNADSDSLEQLKVLYDMRLREIDRLRKDLEIEKDSKEEALHQLALAQSKLESTVESHDRTKQILALSQEKISDLEKLVNSLKSEILKMEKEKHEQETEVEIGHQQILCLQQKISAMERCDIATNREKQVDAFIDGLNAKHQKELAILEQKCDMMTSRYNQKEEECRQLELKLNELERKRSALVLEKCNVALRQESDIQALLDQANAEKLELNRKLVSLQGECDMLKTDLDQYESINKLKLVWGGSSSDEGESFSRLTGAIPRPRPGSAKAQASPQLLDLNAKLKEELHRAILGKRAKRHEINKLQEQVRSKELQIQEMKEKERAYLSQADSLKADITRIMEMHHEKVNQNTDVEMGNVITELKEKIERLTNENQSQEKIIKELNLQIEQLMNDIKSEYSTRVKQGEEYIGFHDSQLTKLKLESQKLLEQKESEWRVKLEFALSECDEIKRMYMELRSSKNEIASLLEEEKRKLSHLAQQKEHLETLKKDKEAVICQLQEENAKLKAEKEYKNEIGTVEVEANQRSIPQLEEEIERLKQELVELPKKQTKELEGLKSELDSAKVRLIELEKKLKKEFQNKVAVFLAEKESLEEDMRLKDLLIKKLETRSSKSQDSATMTEQENISETDAADPASLERVYKNKLENELKILESRLTTQHSVELAATEERIKNVTVKYYAEQMERLEEKYKNELTVMLSREREKIENLSKILIEKEAEIKKFQSSSEPSEKYLLLQKKLEEDRAKIGEAVRKWTAEVEAMKVKMAEDEKKIQDLSTNLKIEKKNVQKYKMKLDNVKKKMEQDKIENIVKMKNHVDRLVATINQVEEKATEKILKVEQEYAQKEKELKSKFKRKI